MKKESHINSLLNACVSIRSICRLPSIINLPIGQIVHGRWGIPHGETPRKVSNCYTTADPITPSTGSCLNESGINLATKYSTFYFKDQEKYPSPFIKKNK